MRVLGFGGSGHDYCLCSVKDGDMEFALEEERFSRERYSMGMRSLGMASLKRMQSHYGVELADYDILTANSLMHPKLVKYHLGNKVYWVNHHMAHAASSYYTSGFEESAIFVADGCGSNNETISFLYGRGKNIAFSEQYYGYIEASTSQRNFTREHSYGEFYAYFSHICGFTRYQAGKTMGLAPFGKPTFVSLFRKLFYVNKKNVFVTKYEDKRLRKLLWELNTQTDAKAVLEMQQDIAFAVQVILEECVIKQLNYLHRITKSRNLCMAGGTALNGTLNGKILSQTPFTDVYIVPAASDTGSAIGAALSAYYNNTDSQYKPKKLASPYLGISYSDARIKQSLDKHGSKIFYAKYDKEEIAAHAARDLACGRVIGWYQGASEIGPRALGNRSILAHPGIEYIKNHINRNIKYREDFRPFAPSVLHEHAKEYFKMNGLYESPYMLFVVDVKDDKRHEIPAVTHVDGSARIQTVKKDDNALYYSLITNFYQLTGLPMVVNTSFNTKGEPIVETPEDALDTFLSCSLDTLYLGEYKVLKK